jgi:transposase
MFTHCLSIDLTVRKFFCKNPKCKRKIFAEQPGSEVGAYKRFTNRTRERLQKIFVEVSAKKGAYISGLISLPVSPSTGLRLVDSLPVPLADKVSVLGIDDWAYRKGLSYGTILVNIETRRVIDVLPGRDGIALKKWLNQHLEVIIITRDRASAYSCAVSETLPNAIQVADRFHLLKNLSDSVYDIIRQEYRNLANSLVEDSAEETMFPEKIDEDFGKVPQREKGEMNDYFKERFEKVKEMQKQGYGFRVIAKTLQMSRNTVHRYENMDVLPKKSIYIKNNYTDYQEIIERDFFEGKCVKEIFVSIKKAGFKGSLTGFYKYFKDHPPHTTLGTKVQSPTKFRMISPRKISRYLSIADLNKIKDNSDRKTMASLLSRNALLEKLRHLRLSFKELLSGNDDASLEDWIREALAIGKSQIKRLVNGLKSDIDAVRNAIKTSWSNGQVEGQVNRLKSIKRQMYGRAGFEHLRRKVILGMSG